MLILVQCSERLLAAQNPLSHADRPHQLFADAPPMGPGGVPLPVPMMPPPPPPGQPAVPPPLSGMMPPPPMSIPPPSSMFVCFYYKTRLVCCGFHRIYSDFEC
jgi:splicing factor 3B subunit 4